MVDINIYIILVGLIIFLSILVVAITLTHTQALKRLKKIEDEENKYFEETKQAEKAVLTQASNKAAELISQATQIHNSTEENINKAVATLSETEKKLLEEKLLQIAKSYEEEIKKINGDNIEMFKNVSNGVMNQIKEHLDQFTKILESQTVESQKIADEKIRGEYEKLEQELAEHKQKSLEKIDHNIYTILLNISKVAFGRALNVQDHEKLILEALEDAKKAGNL